MVPASKRIYWWAKYQPGFTKSCRGCSVAPLTTTRTTHRIRIFSSDPMNDFSYDRHACLWKPLRYRRRIDRKIRWNHQITMPTTRSVPLDKRKPSDAQCIWWFALYHINIYHYSKDLTGGYRPNGGSRGLAPFVKFQGALFGGPKTLGAKFFFSKMAFWGQNIV